MSIAQIFPLPSSCAVTGFEAFVDDKHLIGVVKEKEQARKEYKQAVAAGKGAYLLDQGNLCRFCDDFLVIPLLIFSAPKNIVWGLFFSPTEDDSTFVVSIGNIPPKAIIMIKIVYVSELQFESPDTTVLQIPTSLYPPSRSSGLNVVTQTTTTTEKIEAADHFSVEVAIQSPFDIRSIISPTHTIKVKTTMQKATVCANESSFANEDFILRISATNALVPRMWLEESPEGGFSAVTVFCPNFETESTALQGSRNEFVFLVDRSSSMASSMREVQAAVIRVIQTLPKTVTFNVWSFGSSFHRLFPRCEKATHTNKATAIQAITTMTANLGSTDLETPFSLLVARSKALADDSSRGFLARETQILLFTDGQATNRQGILELCSQKPSFETPLRVFTMAFTKHANRQFLTSLAHRGAGACEHPPKPAYIVGAVKRQLHRALQPSLSSVNLHWGVGGASEASMIQAPRWVSSIFAGERSLGNYLLCLFFPSSLPLLV
jgi:poly [ADP-ribose] polymerase